MAGHPGGSSKVISTTNGLLLECTGGSGALHVRGFDTMNGGATLVPGPQQGATYGSGIESIPNTDLRLAAGPYSIKNSPGACGPADYGRGNAGNEVYTEDSGTYDGGLSPLGYGSGGDIAKSGCYVTPTDMGKCVYERNGRKGVVIIDVVY